MVTRLLHLCGLDLGPDDALMPPHAQDNPAGYWENLRFTDLNDEILAALGGRWDQPPPLDSPWWKQPAFEAFRQRAVALLADFEQQDAWGWKDPRNCLTLPFWLDLVPDLKVLFCLRNPLEIVWSLSRGGETRSIPAKDSLRLWQIYHEQLLSTLRPAQFVTTHYAVYFYRPEAELRRVLDALDMQVAGEVVRQATATIEPGLRHMAYPGRTLPRKGVPRRVVQLYNRLCKESGPVYQHMLADEAYGLKQLKENGQKQYALLVAEGDRALGALKEAEALRATRDRLDQSVRRLEGERANLEAEHARLAASVGRLEGEQAALEAEQEALKAERAALEADRVGLSETVGRLEGKKDAQAETLDRLRDEKAVFAASVRRLEVERATLEAERIALVEKVGGLEGEKASQAETVGRFERQRAEREAERMALAEKVGRLEGERASQAETVGRLERQRAEAEAARMALAEKVGRLEGERATLAETVGRLERQRAEVASERMALAETVGRLEGEKATLAETVDRVEGEKATLAEKVGGLEGEKASLAETVSVLEDEKATLAETVDRVEGEKASLAETVSVLEDEKATLAETVSALEDEKATLAETVSVLEDEKATLAETVSVLKDEKATLAETVSVLEDEKASLGAERTRLAASVGHLEDEKSALQAQRDYLQRERDAVQRSFLWRTLVRLQDLRRGGLKHFFKKIFGLERRASPLRVFLDHPSSDIVTPVAWKVYVGGWAVSTAGPMERVEAFLGDKPLGTIPHGLDRPDVAASFPKMAHAGQSGYERVLDLQDAPPGEHALVVRVTDAAGNSLSVRRRIIVAGPSDVAAPAAATPEPAPEKEEKPPTDQKGKKYIQIDQAVWHDGYLEVEGWVMWPLSLPPRMLHVWMGEQLIAKTRCNLSRPAVYGRFPDDLKPYCRGFRLSRPLLPAAQAGSERKKTPFVLEVVDQQGQKLRREITLRYEGETPPGQGDGLDRALKQFVIDYQTRTGRRPSILDWNTGLHLKQRFPQLAIFLPPVADAHPLLPYVDRSIDVVFCPTDAQAFVTEARRVAQGAVLSLREGQDGQAGPRLQVAWQPEIEAAGALPGTSIIIPVYNQAHYTRQLIEQLRLTLPDLFTGEVLVVDDCSTDETPDMLAALAQEWPTLRVLRNPHNLGFIGSCNRGAEAATGTFLLFLNNDTLPQPGWFVPLLETFARYPDAGAVGGKLIYPDGTLQEAGGIIFSDGSGWNFGRNDPAIDHPLYNHVREVDYCSGALLATRRELFLALGGFDTRYQPAYYEDADYCFTLREQGLKVYYQPESVVVHFEGVSSGTDITAGVKRNQAINKRKFVDKWRQALAHQPPPPPAVNQKFRYQLVVRDAIEEGEHYAY